MELDELHSYLIDGTMLSPADAICCLRALNAEENGQPPALRHQPVRWFTHISGSISHIKRGVVATVRPLLLLLLLSQELAESELFSSEQQEQIGFVASLPPSSRVQRFGVTYAAAAHSKPPYATAGNFFQRNEETEDDMLQLRPYGDSVTSAGAAAAVGFFVPHVDAHRGSASSWVSRTSLPVQNGFQVHVPELPGAQRLASKGSYGRHAPLAGEDAREAGRGKDRKARDKAPAAEKGRTGRRREDEVGVAEGRREITEGVPSRDTNGEATQTGRDRRGGGTRGSRGSERHRTGRWDSSRVPFRQTVSGTNGKYSKALDKRFSKLPPPLPHSRVLPALRSFEHVHGQLTLFFNGFSRGGSVIAYDLLNELRTVSEAKLMMDVEFLVLDRVMEYYGTPTHMRVVDTTVVHKLLDLGNLLPWRIPHLVASIRRLAVEYQPVLREFLDRYEPIIEALVLVKVPPGLKPLRPLLARMFGIPKEKLVLASDLKDLRDLIPLKYIPREFGNANGGRVRDGLENRMSWKIMLEEIAEKLGEDAVSPAGKKLLNEFREEQRNAVAGAVTGKSNKSDRSMRTGPPAAPVTEFMNGDDGAGEAEYKRREAVLRGDEDTWGENGLIVDKGGNRDQRTSDSEDSEGEELPVDDDESSDEDSDFM